ncbi:MAG: hypothetical protein R3C26_07585 [Calditrichia bacterium]
MGRNYTRFPITGGSLGAEEPYLKPTGFRPAASISMRMASCIGRMPGKATSTPSIRTARPAKTLYEGELYPNDSPNALHDFPHGLFYAAFPVGVAIAALL